MLRNKLEICASLAWETLRRPRWAYHHFWGYVDERLLLRFHRANDGNMGANLKTINEALSVAAAEDAGFLAALNEQFAMVCGKQESPADTSSPIRAQNDASLELTAAGLLFDFVAPSRQRSGNRGGAWSDNQSDPAGPATKPEGPSLQHRLSGTSTPVCATYRGPCAGRIAQALVVDSWAIAT